MSYFMQNGNTFQMTSERQTTIHEELPRGFYSVMFHPMRGYYLQLKDDVKGLPPKLYGSITNRAQRIVKTFYDRKEQGLQTGVLLSGEKGSGKTLLARYLMDLCELPVIIVSDAYTDKEFLDLLAAGGSKMVLFDEFEKVYRQEEKQSALLSMLDGYYNTCNLTVATLNDSYRLVEAMKNRPSRFYYHYRYVGLDKEFIAEYCKDRLRGCTDAKITEIRAVSQTLPSFNFDMLQSLVEEMNRFGDNAEECLRHINIVRSEANNRYKVSATNLDTNTPVLLHQKSVATGTIFPDRMSFNLDVMDENGRPKDNLWLEGEHFNRTDEDGNHIFQAANYEVVLAPQFTAKHWAL